MGEMAPVSRGWEPRGCARVLLAVPVPAQLFLCRSEAIKPRNSVLVVEPGRAKPWGEQSSPGLAEPQHSVLLLLGWLLLLCQDGLKRTCPAQFKGLKTRLGIIKNV